MRCTHCRQAVAAVELRRHHAAYCPDCFVTHCRRQVRRVIEEHHMLRPGERVAVAVSGGKDSLALWDMLADLGYETEGVHLRLGIGDYSASSTQAARAFATARGARLLEVDLEERYGFGVPDAARSDRRPACGACGMTKRHVLNRMARDHGHEVLATGHNLDDEAAVLLGNVLRWSMEDLSRQRPALPATEGFARRVKPLVRLSERETAAYCVLRGIDYVVDECPMAAGNRHLTYKDTLDALEERSPGTKAAFYQGFLRQAKAGLGTPEEEKPQLRACARCGSPTTVEICAFCRLADRASSGRRRLEARAAR